MVGWVVLSLGGVELSGSPVAERVWTDREGRTMVGSWRGVEGEDILRIEQEDGQWYAIRRSILGADDFEYSKEYWSQIGQITIPEGMVLIPGGIFTMGDATGLQKAAQPLHRVETDAFLIGRNPVTYAEWRKVVEWATAPERGSRRYRFEHEGRAGGGRAEGATMPVTTVNWYDVLKWCNARSEMEGREPVYYLDGEHRQVYRVGRNDLSADQVRWVAHGYRLATEAEWERAARGGREGLPYVWGESAPQPRNANYWNSGATNGTNEVGRFGPNPYGLYEMAGNVWEWTWNRWGGFPGGDWRNPTGVANASHRVTRGGSWSNPPNELLVSYRRVTHPTNSYPRIGFRVVISGEDWGKAGWNEPLSEGREQGKRVDGR